MFALDVEQVATFDSVSAVVMHFLPALSLSGVLTRVLCAQHPAGYYGLATRVVCEDMSDAAKTQVSGC